MNRSLPVLMLCGGVIGLLTGCIMTAIAAPNFSNLPLAWPQALELERISRLNDVFAGVGRWGGLLALAALLCSWTFVARGLNAKLPPFPFHRGPRPGLAWTAVLLSACVVAAGVSTWYSFGMPRFRSESVNSTGDAVIALLLAAAGGALSWLILAPAGWAGDFSAWRKPAAAFGPGWSGRAALGASFSAALCFGLWAVERLFMFLFSLNVEVWNPGMEVDYAALLANIAIVTALGAFCFAVAGGLAEALAPDGAPAVERARRARPALALSFLAAAAVGLLHQHAVSRHQWRAGALAEAALLPDRVPPAMTMVTFAFDKAPKVVAKDWPLSARSSGWVTSGEVAATAANAEELKKFLAGAGKTSRFRVQAGNAVPVIYAVLWDPVLSFSSQRDLPGGSSLIGQMLERSWLIGAAPITPENRARLEELSDEKKYRLPPKAAWNLGKGWRRFGDLERARRLLKDAEPSKEFAIPAQAPLTDGRVRGRLLLKGKPLAGARVGLFRLNEGETSAAAVYPGHGTVSRVVEAKTLGADGAFEFAHVAEGRYSLSALVPQATLAASAGVSAARHPGIIVLDRARPRSELGPIDLSAR